jgi:hypothetical protein
MVVWLEKIIMNAMENTLKNCTPVEKIFIFLGLIGLIVLFTSTMY